MRERPILFSSPMVRAILDGRKTQTRRVVKPHKAFTEWGVKGPDDAYDADVDDAGQGFFLVAGDMGYAGPVPCPYGQPGDRLWVRETMEVSYQGSAYYAADGAQIGDRDELGDLCERYGHPYFFNELKGIPSIHMPRWASRITLEVTGVRVERLQDISEKDAKAEGALKQRLDDLEPPTHWRGFKGVWESINGAGSWDANPWVWVVEFRRL